MTVEGQYVCNGNSYVDVIVLKKTSISDVEAIRMAIDLLKEAYE